MGPALVALAALALAATGPDWFALMNATHDYMLKHMWNPANGNFIRRTDVPAASQKSDAWGITIVLDAYATMVESGTMKPDDLKNYYRSSTALYERTNGASGARIIARMQAGPGESGIYVGGDDEMQWIAALAHCYEATHDEDYLTSATTAFKALLDLGFWKDGTQSGAQTAPGAQGWVWNSNDQRPNGVSTAYGALAAARLYRATHQESYKLWCAASINALSTPQVGYFPRDMMVASDAALTAYEECRQTDYLDRAKQIAKVAIQQGDEVLKGKRAGERNPTDIGDLGDGLLDLYRVTGKAEYKTSALHFIQFFLTGRTPQDIAANGFGSRYSTTGQPIIDGAYLGVPLTARYLPEVAEMLKLTAMGYGRGK